MKANDTIMRNAAIVFILLMSACGQRNTSDGKPMLDGNCGYLTRGEVEEVLGRALDSEPTEIAEEYLGGKGCSYSAGKDGQGNAYFAYAIVSDEKTFEMNATNTEAVSGIGDQAYTFNGPDAQQLWVRQGSKYVMIAIGDAPNLDGCKKLASLMLERMP
jgi:hypothetical protein